MHACKCAQGISKKTIASVQPFRLAPPAPLGFSTPLYVGFYALVANLVIVFVGSAVARFFLSQEQKSYGMLAEEEREEPERA
jgi:hypothetical protein